MQQSSEHNKANKLTTTLLVIYIAMLFWILLFKFGVQFSYMEKRSVNLVPFRGLLTSNALAETILNVLIFVPFGIYVSVLFKRWALTKKLLVFFLLSFMFEVLQFILAIGTFDITDIITNTFGSIIGLLIFKAIEKLFSNSIKLQHIINVIALVATVLLVVLLVLLKLNMLPIRYQ